MKILYIDESGCTGTLLYPDIQPLLIICGIIADSNDLYNITRELINIKVKYSPNRKAIHFLDNILWEIKGSELRKHIRESGKLIRRHTFFSFSKK